MANIRVEKSRGQLASKENLEIFLSRKEPERSSLPPAFSSYRWRNTWHVKWLDDYRVVFMREILFHNAGECSFYKMKKTGEKIWKMPLWDETWHSRLATLKRKESGVCAGRSDPYTAGGRRKGAGREGLEARLFASRGRSGSSIPCLLWKQLETMRTEKGPLALMRKWQQ